MALAEHLEQDVAEIVETGWDKWDGITVPEPADVALGNNAVNLEATVLYADLAASTELVAEWSQDFAAEVYKCFLRCAARIIRSQRGTITAFDGDRIMGVFVGGYKNTSAAHAALNINYATTHIITRKIREFYSIEFTVQHAVGIDTGPLMVARTGIRGSNDLVWVGRAANYAAKLSSLREHGCSSWITADVYARLNKEAKYAVDGRNMWTSFTWKPHGITVYGSNWWWEV
jgi:class 3 adenylate cyclase